ncbi:MAG: AMP-binding protein [Vulcanimicrobiota bacterium]
MIECSVPATALQNALYLQQNQQFFSAALPDGVTAEALVLIWHQLMLRHQCLRSRLGDGQQIILTQLLLPVGVYATSQGLDAEMVQIRAEPEHPHKLALGLGPRGERRLFWSSYHAFLDGRSRAILWEEMLALLRGESLPPAPSWSEYLCWRAAQAARATRFWDNYLAGTEGPWLPPGSVNQPASLQPIEVRRKDSPLPLSCQLQAAWARVLSRLSGRSEIVMGCVRACRRSNFAGIERLVGLVINTLPLRATPALEGWPERLTEDWRSFAQHELGEPDRSLFDTLVSLETAPLPYQRSQLLSPTNYALTVRARADGEHWHIELDYDSQAFSIHQAGQILQALGQALQGAEPELERLARPCLQARNEVSLGDIWSEVLGCEVHESTHFFEAGGDSLKLMRMLALARQQLGLVLTPQQVAQQPRLGDLQPLRFSSQPLSARIEAAALGYWPEWLQGASAETPYFSRILETAHGRLGVITLPLHDHQLYAQPQRLTDLLEQAVSLARQAGAGAISLTGLLPSALGAWSAADMTSGHGATVAAVVLNLLRALQECGRSLERENLAIMGFGSIGQGVLALLQEAFPRPARLIVCDRPNRLTGLELPGVELAPYLDGLPEAMRQATVIIGATNVPGVLPLGELACGTILVDDSWPPCYPTEEQRRRRDLLLLEGGWLQSPEPLRQLSYLPAGVELEAQQRQRLSFFRPHQLTGCMLASLLIARGLAPATTGTVTGPHALEWLRHLQESGYSAADPECAGFARVKAHVLDESMVDRFEHIAQLHGQRTALTQDARHLTYGQLEERSRRVAGWLQTQGVQPGMVVAVDLPRSLEMVVAWLAVLRTGAAYLPLDELSPPARRQLQLENSGACLVLKQLHESEGYRRPEMDPGQLAYILYTSGTTGRPKGVEIEHRSVVRLVVDNYALEVDQNEVFLHSASPAFDISVLQIWGALLNGARCVVHPQGLTDLAEWGEVIAREKVSLATLTPAVFNLVVETCPHLLEGLGTLYVGGDMMSLAHARKARQFWPEMRLINSYGPTECTCHSNCYELPARLPDDLETMPIGPPVAHSRCYVLNEAYQPVSVGEVGELWIGGTGLARGYRNQPELTEQRFVRLPMGRLYRTGDLARWDEQGRLLVFSRTDRQIKLRGFRVDLNEVESVLREHQQVRDAAVIFKEGQLLAFVEGPCLQLESYLQQRPPAYMIPHQIRSLEQLPLTVSGKLDRESL